LWLKYSQNRFGFSVQKKIWVDNGGKFDGESDWDTYEKLGNKVGWKMGDQKMGIYGFDHSQTTFNINAPRGHLPVARVRRDGLGCSETRVWGLLYSLL
jgi:serine protease Do